MPSITNVDPYQLDKHFAEHADEYQKWADKLAEAEADLDDLNTELELVEAEVADNIRRNPKDYGATSTSEAMIGKLVPLTREYQDAKRAVNEKKRLVGKLKVAVKALDRKGTAIEKLTALWLGGYYAAPRSPKFHQRGLPPPIDKRAKK